MAATSSQDPELAKLQSFLALAPAGANVILQLSQLPIGRGVVESTVESGSLYRHPVKRTRTTLSYIAIALWGTDDERLVVRAEVNRQHRHVRSSEDSPVDYDAFDPELQLWVAACMYRGVEDAVTFLYGPQTAESLDVLYRHCARFATTLQVPESMWPRDRAAFDHYWSRAEATVTMDGATRAYLSGIASLTFLPRPVSLLAGPAHRFITAGFLPEALRRELGLTWDARREARFQKVAAAAAWLNRATPRPLRAVPWNVALWDAKRRIRHGRAIMWRLHIAVPGGSGLDRWRPSRRG